MADLPGQARIVIIGGGVVGVSSLYHLAKSGWTDCMLLVSGVSTCETDKA